MSSIPGRLAADRMSPDDRIDVSPLADSYDIVAELGTGGSTRSYIGKRRADGKDVVITVARTPAGDERNALTHLAADVNLLATLRHRHLVPVLEGRWLGAGAFAVVSERVFAPTVDELLGRGEQFSNARIAAILREVNGILDWARRERVVHRAVTADGVFLEQGSDRVLVAFAIRPIPLTGAPDAEGDAMTVATLARAMLARSAEDVGDIEDPEERLAAARPDLPARLIERTEALLHPTRGGEAPDVPGYLAMIAMADAVKAGEDESSRVTAQALEEQRLTKAQLEAERQEQERQLADERQRLTDDRAALEREIAAERERLTAERTELERTMTQERERLTRQRAEMMAAIGAAHAELARERKLLEGQRLAAFERGAQPGGRPPFDRLRERARTHARGLMGGAADVAGAEGLVEDGEAHDASAEHEVARGYVPAADAPPVVELPAADALGSADDAMNGEPAIDVGRAALGSGAQGYRAWAVPAAGITLVGIVLASVLALVGGHRAPAYVAATGDSVAADSASQLRASSDSGRFVLDSAAGTVTTGTTVANATPAAAGTNSASANGTRVDSTRIDSAATDSAAAADSARVAAARRAAALRRRRARAAAAAARDSAMSDSTLRSDPFAIPSTTPRADTGGARRDSASRSKPDSTPPM